MGLAVFVCPRVPDVQNIEHITKSRTVYVTKEMADALYEKAECILLAVEGKYYYSENFRRFIEIQEWEYHRILNWPYLYYFSTALKKHVDWREANRKGTTLTFLEAVAGDFRSWQGAGNKCRTRTQTTLHRRNWRNQ
jgi:hypothetical protein